MPEPYDVLAMADRLWRGEVTTSEVHPLRPQPGLAEVAPGVAFVPSFANVSAVDTGDGLVLVDTGSAFLAGTVHDTVQIQSTSGNVVTAQLAATQTDGKVKTFQGTYTVTDGIISGTSVQQVS